jgi:hypothetical protein
MTDDPTPRTDPLPPDMVGRLDFDRITQRMGAFVCEDEWLRDELAYGRLTWTFEGWADDGSGQVLVLHKPTGAMVAGARVHWSALVV